MPEALDKNAMMKECFNGLVKQLEAQGIDLNETPAVFEWNYDEDPELTFLLKMERTPVEFQALSEKINTSAQEH